MKARGKQVHNELEAIPAYFYELVNRFQTDEAKQAYSKASIKRRLDE